MKTVAAAKFKATCLKLMEQVAETGEPIQVTKRGKPLVVITPPKPQPKRKSIFGAGKHLILWAAPWQELLTTGAVWEADELAKEAEQARATERTKATKASEPSRRYGRERKR